jgi:uncharacterized membrane protein YfcA
MLHNPSLLLWLKIIETGLASIVLVAFYINRPSKSELLSWGAKTKTFFTAIIANFGDTFGIGSFATIIALRRSFRLMPDEKNFLGLLNIHAVFTSVLQSVIFLHFIDVSNNLMIISCILSLLGGAISGYITVKIKVKFIRMVMLYAFCGVAIILVLNQLHLLNAYNEFKEISGIRLVIFCTLFFFASFLPAFGIGFYSLVQVLIFLLGANPLIAFPIMTTTSAIQTTATSYVFIASKKYYFKSTLIMIIAGLIGVAIAAPLVAHINPYYLKWLLLVVVVYNIYTLIKKNKVLH